MKNNSIAKSQILEASIMGTEAFKIGIKCAPFYDTRLNKFFIGKEVGKTPTGEAKTTDIFKAWTNAWTAASLSNARLIMGFK